MTVGKAVEGQGAVENIRQARLSPALNNSMSAISRRTSDCRQKNDGASKEIRVDSDHSGVQEMSY